MELLLKASGYLEFCVRDVLAHLRPDIKYINGIVKLMLFLDCSYEALSMIIDLHLCI